MSRSNVTDNVTGFGRFVNAVAVLAHGNRMSFV